MKKFSKLWCIIVTAIVVFSFMTMMPIGEREVQADGDVHYHMLFSSDEIFMVGEDAQAFINSVVPKERDISIFSKFNVRLFWTDGHVELTEQTSGILQSRRYHLFIEMELKNDFFPEKAEEKLDFMIEDRNKDLTWEKGNIDTNYTTYAKVELITDLTPFKMVTFDVNGGTPDAPMQIVKQNGTADIPVQPKKDGYTFAGWWTKADGGQKYNFTEPVLGDLKLTARWDAIAPPATTTIPETVTTLTDPPLTTSVPEESTSSIASDETVPDTTLPEESSTTTSETETAVAVVDDEPSNPKWLLFVGIGLIVILGTLMTWLIVVAKKQRRNDTNNQSGPNNPNRPNTPYPPSGQTGQYPQRNQYPLGNRGQKYPPSSPTGQYRPYQPGQSNAQGNHYHQGSKPDKGIQDIPYNPDYQNNPNDRGD